MTLYKNWKKICEELGKENPMLMMVIACASLASRVGKGLIKGFPEYFSEIQSNGPVPLSALMHAHEEYLSASNQEPGISDCLVTSGVIDRFSIPYLLFGIHEPYRGCIHPVPGSLYKALRCKRVEDIRVGSIRTWKDQRFVIVEGGGGSAYIGISPAEYIAVKL